MARAYSPSEILKMNYATLQWRQKWVEAFSNPETTGIWFIAGASTNGKTSFIMELMKELATLNMGKIFFNSFEEGTRKTLQDSIRKHGIEEVKKNVLIGSENLKEIDKRLSKRKSAKVVIIDSVQAARITNAEFAAFKEKYQYSRLLIFISQVEGKSPKGKVAENIRYYADLKIWVEGFRAISQGRYNAGGHYTIWDEGAIKYWGLNDKQTEK